MDFTPPPEERRRILYGYRDEVKRKNSGQPDKLEEDPFTKTIHMNRNLGDWKEYQLLSYNENVIGHMLLTEIEHLRRAKRELHHLLGTMGNPGGVPPVFPWGMTRSLDNTEDFGDNPEQKD